MFSIENGILREYSGSDSEVTIPDGVKSIGEGAFQWNEDIVSVYIPDSVTEICDDAFFACKNLKNIRLSENTRKIGGYAFSKCEKLAEITLPRSLCEIGTAAFEWCAVEEIAIPDSVEIISDNLLRKCRNLRTVSIGRNCKHIGNSSFASTGIEEFTMPDTVLTLGAGAFKNCDKLKKVRLSENLRIINDETFNCSALNEIDLPESIIKIGKKAFRRCKLKKIKLEKYVSVIEDEAFNLNKHLRCEFTVPPRQVGKSAFPSANVPKGVEFMYSTSFCGQTDKSVISEITVPDSVITFIPENFRHIIYFEKYKMRLFIGRNYYDGATPLLDNSEMKIDGYDSLFSKAEEDEKPIIALLRLTHNHGLTGGQRKEYEKALAENTEAAAVFAVENNDSAALTYMLENGCVNSELCDVLYDRAHELNHISLLSVLTAHNKNADPFDIFNF